MTEQRYVPEGLCYAGRWITDDVDPLWKDPCPRPAVHVVTGVAAEPQQFCQEHVLSLYRRGVLHPDWIVTPKCGAGRRVTGPEEGWTEPCTAPVTEVVVLRAREGEEGHPYVWFCQQHFDRFVQVIGPSKLTFEPTPGV